MATGDSMTYVSAADHDGTIPLPRGGQDGAGYVRPHAAVAKPKGLDWDALTPKCRQCGTPSGQLADGALCPNCRGVAPVDVFAKPGRTVVTAATQSTRVTSTYDQLDDGDVARRFTAETAGPTDRSAAGTGKGKPTRQPAAPSTTTQETTVTSPPFPTYIVDIAVVMRDSENHHDPLVRGARKAVANALVDLNRELTRVGSPAASTSHDDDLGSPRRRRGPLADNHDDLIAAHLAGATSNTLGAKYGVSGSAVRQYIRRHTNPTGATA